MGKGKKGSAGITRKHPSNRRGGPLDAQGLQKMASIDEENAVTTQTLSNKIVICRQTGCHDISTTHGFCRFHYLASWKKMKSKEAKKRGQELEVYLTEMSRKFPEEFLEKLRSELEEVAEKERVEEGDDATERGLFDAIEGDEDIDTIIKGLKVEDY